MTLNVIKFKIFGVMIKVNIHGKKKADVNPKFMRFKLIFDLATTIKINAKARACPTVYIKISH